MINGGSEGGSVWIWIYLNATAPLPFRSPPAVISVHECGLCATLHVKGSAHLNC